MSQFDIGFNTGMKKWFVQGYSATRFTTAIHHLADSNLKLVNTMCDTYSWPDGQNPQITHGRLRFYSDAKQEIKAKGDLADSYTVTGPNEPFKFLKLHGKTVLKYNIPTMTWSFTIDGNEYTTKNIVGKITGEAEKERIRFDVEESDIYFNSYITLIGAELETA